MPLHQLRVLLEWRRRCVTTLLQNVHHAEQIMTAMLANIGYCSMVANESVRILGITRRAWSEEILSPMNRPGENLPVVGWVPGINLTSEMIEQQGDSLGFRGRAR